VRKLARERGINLSQVSGSGPNGRVLLSDLAVGAQTKAPTGNYSYAVDARPKSVPGSREVERIPLRGLRKKIVEKMAISKRTAAHFTCVEECDVTELVAFRNSIKDEAKARGVNMTFMPFIAKACLFALRKFPELNSQLVEDGAGGGEILRKHYYNFGIAVDTEDGLTVPVVHDVDQKSLMDLARDIGDAGSRARDRKLAAADFADGTFTITNAGKVGGLFATPVINYPEVAIMGVHEIRKRPWVVDGEIKIRDIMYVSISLDHRIVDGAKGILFLNEVNSYLSNPKKFLLEMV
jgi:pyruvate dehydrogenase E2 component (dihydrolipoamide acetyltransferase)